MFVVVGGGGREANMECRMAACFMHSGNQFPTPQLCATNQLTSTFVGDNLTEVLMECTVLLNGISMCERSFSLPKKCDIVASA